MYGILEIPNSFGMYHVVKYNNEIVENSTKMDIIFFSLGKDNAEHIVKILEENNKLRKRTRKAEDKYDAIKAENFSLKEKNYSLKSQMEALDRIPVDCKKGILLIKDGVVNYERYI